MQVEEERQVVLLATRRNALLCCPDRLVLPFNWCIPAAVQVKARQAAAVRPVIHAVGVQHGDDLSQTVVSARTHTHTHTLTHSDLTLNTTRSRSFAAKGDELHKKSTSP